MQGARVRHTVTGLSQRFIQIVHCRFSSKEPLPPAASVAEATFACLPGCMSNTETQIIANFSGNIAPRLITFGQ